MKPAGPILASCNLAVAGLQLFFFLPIVVGRKSLDVVPWGGGPLLFRLDWLSLLFGVAWSLALALTALAIELDGKGWAWTLLTTAGLLGTAYAREPILFFAGWELAGLGVWLAMPVTPGRARIAALMYGAGLPLLLLLLLGVVGAFVPPAGGAAQEWPLWVLVLLGLTVFLRTISPALYHPSKQDSAQRLILLWAVYASTGPFLLAKALVEGRWDAWEVWALTLACTAGLLAIVVLAQQKIISEILAASIAISMLAIIGFGLAPVSPLAAVGAVLLLGLGAFLPPLSMVNAGTFAGSWTRGAFFAGCAVGLWLVVQGALVSRYPMTAIIVLPVIVLVCAYAGFNSARDEAGTRYGKIAFAVALLIFAIAAIYPQASVEWFARPVASALAGGVGVSSGLTSQWALGLTSASANETLVAALPATGIALAIFLAWVALYWLKGLLSMLRKSENSNSAPPESP